MPDYRCMILMLVLIYSACGCSQGSDGRANRDTLDQDQNADTAVRKRPDLIGLTDAQVVKIFGEPWADFKLTIGKDGFGEEYVEVFNTYPPNDPKSKGVMIRIVKWKMPGYTTEVQMHRVAEVWRVLIAFEFDDGVVF